MLRIFTNLLVRNFLKDKLLNSLNILGLSLGMIAAMLILLYADHEFSYDSFHKDVKNTYRLEAITNNDLWFSNIGMEHGKELTSGRYPEVETVVQLNGHPRAFLSYNNQRYSEEKIYQTKPGSDFFELFSFKELLGNRETFLNEPYVTVITASTAEKYFGKTSPLGQVIKYDSIPLKITGVIEDLPTNSHLDFNILYANPVTFGQDHFHTQSYIQLVNDADPTGLEVKIKDMDVARDEFHTLSEVRLMPVEDIYFGSDAVFGSGGKGDILQLTVFMIIGGLILLIAVANYINLSLAVYSSKGLEIGMRKVLGESRSQIIRAFIWESILMTFMTIPLVILGLYFLLPVFSEFLEVNLQNKLLSSPIYWAVTLAFVITLSIITVAYPATLLTRTKISELIKSKSAVNNSSGVKLRNALIFVQFILLFTLGISAWFMNRQIDYLDSKDMGFNADRVIKVTNAFSIGEYKNYQLLKSQLLTHPQVAGVSFGPMMGDGSNPLAYKPEGSDQTYENLLSYGVDIDYFDVMGMNITAGDFKTVLQSAEDGQIVSLVNESFIERFGWQDDPIGKKLILRPGSQNELHRQVSAVFKDFHYFTLKEKVTPQIISLRPDPQFVNTNLLIRASTDNLQEVTDIIAEEWNKVVPSVPLEYDLMDEAVKRMYAKERQTGQVSVTFSVLAVVLSLLGLIGFMIYVTGLKSKEIAVRKVLGASLLQIIALLNRQLFLAILFSAIIGSAFSYWLVSTWLNDYAYAIALSPVTFIAAAALVYSIVFMITALQSVKSAQIDPVMALKHE
ncbi:MAG: FtsX-like permease family protein [Roseivirga sp.]|nr:FtsX-like permease family protein [Roseivirga sp.]